ncbi:MAG: TlpA disulfide reductase family protein [Planctomycetota bacterium]|nr:TlpA disulfide reductase family protein [Planctomycetota bacterium]
MRIWMVITVAMVGFGAAFAFAQEAPSRRIERGLQGVNSGWMRAVLRIDAEHEIPFFLRRPIVDGGPALIRNGEEEIEVEARIEGTQYIFDFPHYDSRITADIQMHGLLTGEWTKTGPEGEQRTLRFEASRIPNPNPRIRFPRGGEPGAPHKPERFDFSGEWKMQFSESGIAKGVFEQAPGGVLSGTILTPTGDYRYLAGNVYDNRMSLSVFDGAHAFLFEGELDPLKGTVEGEFFSGSHWHETFTAERAEEGFELPDAFSEVVMAEGETRLRLAALDDPRYQVKPVIVTFFGTWCPNCNDEASLLRELYEKHHGEGLQMLGLAYEHTGADERSLRQVERFKQRHGIGWQVIVNGVSDKAKASASLPQVSAIRSWPTTVFINRDGTVRAIHSGFAGPATGEEHTQLRAEFERLAREIVASKP